MVFTDSISKQFNRITPNDVRYKLYGPLNRFLPFIIRRPTSPNPVQVVKLINFDTGVSIPIAVEDFPHELKVNSTDIYDYVIYHGLPINGLLMTEKANYYLDVDGMVSEVFTAVSDLSCYIKLEWRNSRDICNYIYQTGFEHRVYLDADILQPDPVFEEEGSNDEDGVFVPEFQRSYKLHKISRLLIPEYLFDQLRKIWHHDQVRVNNEYVSGFEFEGGWADLYFFNANISYRGDECVSRGCPEDYLVFNLGEDTPPVLQNPLDDIYADTRSTYQFPEDTFSGVVTQYSSTLSNGNPLPSWLQFDGPNRTYSWLGAGENSNGVYTIKLVASNGSGSDEDVFDFELDVTGEVA